MRKFVLLFIFNLILLSCARVGSPVGGPKDSLAPEFLGSNLDTSRVNVKRDIRELRLYFDEYVNLKDVNKNLIISPPIKKIKKIQPSTLASKYVLIQWEDTLQVNTTYNFNFGNSIVDFNEGNILPYFNYAFSTGSKIDNLYISGEVKNALSAKTKNTEGKDRNLVVGLYKNSDSIDYRQKPYYITKVDEDGYYELNYLSPGDYKILAFEDSNLNSTYDVGKENVGFQKEVLHLEKSISGLNLKIFPSKKQIKYKEMKESPGGITMLFEGKPEKVEVLSLNDNLKEYKVTHRPKSDTVNIWFDAKKQEVGIGKSENLRFSYDAVTKKDTVSIFYKFASKDELVLSNTQGNAIPPKQKFRIAANMPVQSFDSNSWKLESDSVKVDFKAEISKTNPQEILVDADFVPGKKYKLSVPKETVQSFYKSNEKSYRFDFAIDQTHNYGSFTLKLQNAPPHKRWIEFLDETEKTVYSRYSDSSELKFDVLKPGTYTLRILEDNNGNGYWDEADFPNGISAEDVYLFPKKIEIKPLWEIVETWDLSNNTAISPK